MAVNPDDTRTGHPLACGRSVEQVFDDLEAGRTDAHAAHCPHCTTARTSLEQLVEATRLLVADPVAPPAGLLDRIMAAVRADLSRAEMIPLPSPSGPLDISTLALAAVLRFVVDGVPGLRAQRCRVELDPVTPYTVRVVMSVSLHYSTGPDAGHVGLLDRARRRVRDALSGQIGLVLREIDFEVVDVWMDPDDWDPDDRDLTGGTR